MSRKAVSVVGGLVVLAAAYTGCGWWFGKQVEQHYAEDFARLANRMGLQNVQHVSYERGIFGSRATEVVTMNIQVPSPEAESSAVEDSDDALSVLDPRNRRGYRVLQLRLHVVQSISHGPIVGGRLAAARIETRLERVEGAPERLRQVMAKASPPTIDTVVAFDGSQEGRISLPAGEIAAPEKEAQDDVRVAWQPGHIDFSVSGDRLRSRFELQWPGLEGRFQPGALASGKPGLKIGITGFSAKADLVARNAQDWLMVPGSYVSALSQMVIKTIPAQPNEEPVTLLSLDGWNGKGSITSSGQLLSSQEKGAGKAIIMDVPLENLGYQVSLSNISETAKRSLQEIVKKMGGSADPVEHLPDEATLRLIVTELSRHSSALGMRFDGTLQGQTAYIDTQVGMLPITETGHGAVPDLLQQVLKILKADVRVHLPKRWTMVIDQRLEKSFGKPRNDCNLDCLLRGQGFAREGADAWDTELRFSDGHVLLNGRQVF